jgi:hypothetical protein
VAGADREQLIDRRRRDHLRRRRRGTGGQRQERRRESCVSEHAAGLHELDDGERRRS